MRADDLFISLAGICAISLSVCLQIFLHVEILKRAFGVSLSTMFHEYHGLPKIAGVQRSDYQAQLRLWSPLGTHHRACTRDKSSQLGRFF